MWLLGARALVQRRRTRARAVLWVGADNLFSMPFRGEVRNRLPRSDTWNSVAPSGLRRRSTASSDSGLVVSAFVSGDGMEQCRHTFKQRSQGRRGLLAVPR